MVGLNGKTARFGILMLGIVVLTALIVASTVLGHEVQANTITAVIAALGALLLALYKTPSQPGT